MSDKSDKLNKKVDLMLFFGQEPAVRQYSSFTWRFCELLGVVFIALKCAGSLQWGWFFVTMPLWGWLWLQILLSLAYRASGLKEMVDKAEEFNESQNKDGDYKSWLNLYKAYERTSDFSQTVKQCKEVDAQWLKMTEEERQAAQREIEKGNAELVQERIDAKQAMADKHHATEKLLSDFFIANRDFANRQQFELEWTRYSKEHDLPINFADCVIGKHFSVPVANDVRLSRKQPNIYDAIGVARSDDTNRKQLNGFCISEDGEIAATDGRRLHFAPYPGSLKPGIWQRIEKRAALNLLQGHTPESVKALRESGEFALDGAWNYNHPFVQAGIHDLPDLTTDGGDWFHSVEGMYPNYRHVVPDGKGYHTIETPKRLIEKLACLKRIMQLGKVKMLQVALRMHDDSCAIFNFDFLHDAVMMAAAHGDCISITMKDVYSPCVIKGGDAVAVLMPLRDVSGVVILNDMDIAGDEKGGSYVKVPKIAGAESKAIATTATTTTSAKKARKQSLASKMADALRKKQKEAESVFACQENG